MEFIHSYQLLGNNGYTVIHNINSTAFDTTSNKERQSLGLCSCTRDCIQDILGYIVMSLVQVCACSGKQTVIEFHLAYLLGKNKLILFSFFWFI